MSVFQKQELVHAASCRRALVDEEEGSFGRSGQEDAGLGWNSLGLCQVVNGDEEAIQGAKHKTRPQEVWRETGMAAAGGRQAAWRFCILGWRRFQSFETSKEGSGREGGWRSRKDKEMAFGARERFHREEGVRVPLPLYLTGWSSAGAGDRGEDDDARGTPGSDRSGMARPGQGDPTPCSPSWSVSLSGPRRPVRRGLLPGRVWGGSPGPGPAVPLAEEKTLENSRPPPPPAVVLAILARNAEHSLPHYLGALERLDYPRARLALW
ncbi:uncharacterized protein LOC112484787 [Pteropus alecto]|uniref:uncharacterized protein LOC112484787 n=1 Tax=Pteropus alecto TaxID=9402 RepID=UPI000D53A50B|nr:uncharacterized protein LOC112484787 [Pteropus alecto]